MAAQVSRQLLGAAVKVSGGEHVSNSFVLGNQLIGAAGGFAFQAIERGQNEGCVSRSMSRVPRLASAQKAPRYAVTVVLPGRLLVERTDAIFTVLASKSID